MKAALLDSLALSFMLVIIMHVLSVCPKDMCPQNDWVKLTQHHICAVRGSSVVMPCSLTPATAQKATEVFWLINAKQGKETTDIANTSSYKERVEYFWKKTDTNKNCTLKLTDVKLTDRANYRARIIAGTDKWQSCDAVQLSVTDLTVSIPTPVMKGSEVKLSCNNGCGLKSNPTVIWRKNGEDLPGKQTGHSELLFPRVRTEDEGNYSCVLKGHEGHPSTPVKLNIMFPPTSTSVSVRPDVNVTMGSSVTLTCGSDANPPVENYTWFKVNKSTPAGSGQQYSITNLRSEDGGQYYCEARNKYGAENSKAVSIIVSKGARSPVLYVIAGLSVFGAAGLICVLLWIRHHRRNAKGTMKEQDGDVKFSNTDIQKTSQSRASAPPSTKAAEGAAGDVLYASVQPKHSRQTVGAAEDNVLYASVQPLCSRQTTKAQGDAVQHASVQLKKAEAAQGSPDQPEGELSVIYSSVGTRTT